MGQPNRSVILSFDVSQNGISSLAEDFFTLSIKRGLNRGRVNLSQNVLGEQSENDTDGRTFKSYKDLTDLDISSNSIKTLPFNIFIGPRNLIRLNLRGNSLR